MKNNQLLLDENKLLTETQLKLIYTSLVGYVGLDPYISGETEREIGNLLEKLEIIVPEIEKHTLYENLKLVADDGLEL